MKEKKIENQIFVGSKKFISYIRSIEYLFRQKKLQTVLIMARGKNILKAVDLAEASKGKFMSDLRVEIKSVELGSETFKPKEGEGEVSVSNIKIELKKR